MFIARPDAQLHALRFGQGPLTLLAVGGWVAGGEVWHPLFGHLPHWRCIGLDHRGSGASRHSGAITVDAMADDLLAVADALQLDRVVLAAESSGAAAALLAAQRAPGRFAGLVLVGAAWQRADPATTGPFADALRRDHLGTLRSFIDRCLPETGSAELRHWALQMMTRSSVDDAIALLRSREAIAPPPRLPRAAPPTLLIHGGRDRIVPPEHAQTLATQLEHAELQLLPALGHVPIVTAAADVARRIDAFAARCIGRAGPSTRPTPATPPAGPDTCPPVIERTAS